MESIYYTMTEKETMRKKFLYIPKTFKEYLDKSNLYWIYQIVNLKDDRVYVGKTDNITRRAMNYINEFLKGDMSRKLTRGFQEVGFDFFIMMPLEIAYNEKSAEFKERYFIDLFNTIDEGFNTYNNSAPTKKIRKKSSTPQTLYARMIKSKLISAVNTENRKIIFSTGLKLFGDYVGRSKDEVKSAARRESRLDGFFIYYMNATDFDSQLLDANSKIKKNTTYKDYRLQYYEFMKYANYLQNLLCNKNNPENFKLYFITQSNSSTGYDFNDIQKFFQYYDNATNRII